MTTPKFGKSASKAVDVKENKFHRRVALTPSPSPVQKHQVKQPKLLSGDGWTTVTKDSLFSWVDPDTVGVESAFPDSEESIDQDKRLLAESGSDVKLVEEKKTLRKTELRTLGTLLAGATRGKKGFYLRAKTTYGGSIQTNSSSAGKFQVQFAGAGTLANTLINSSPEFSAFNTIFEEFFIHSMMVDYIPNNQNLAGYVNSTSTNWQSGMFVMAGYQHNQPVATDALNNFYVFQNSSQHKVGNTGQRLKFRWKNVEKFSKDGPNGDATTASNTQSWLNFGNVAEVGGYISACLPVATNAAPGPSTVAANSLLGYFTVTWDVSFRYRD